jgi:hypothetical protein
MWDVGKGGLARAAIVLTAIFALLPLKRVISQ